MADLPSASAQDPPTGIGGEIWDWLARNIGAPIGKGARGLQELLLTDQPPLVRLLEGAALGLGGASPTSLQTLSQAWQARDERKRNAAQVAKVAQFLKDKGVDVPPEVLSTVGLEPFIPKPIPAIGPDGKPVYEMVSPMGGAQGALTDPSGQTIGPIPKTGAMTIPRSPAEIKAYGILASQGIGNPTREQVAAVMPAAQAAVEQEKRQQKREDILFAERLRVGDRPAPKPHWDPSLGWVYPPGAGGVVPPPVQPPGFKPRGLKSDLDTPLSADMKKGIVWRKPDGSRLTPQQAPDGRAALALGAVPLTKDDNKQFTAFDRLASDANTMVVLFPEVAPFLKTREGRNILSRVLQQKWTSADTKTLAKQNPKVAQYIDGITSLSLEAVKSKLPAGRIPVYDQQLLMGLSVSPDMTPEVQFSQLSAIRDRANGLKLRIVNERSDEFGNPVAGPSPIPSPGPGWTVETVK